MKLVFIAASDAHLIAVNSLDIGWERH